MSGPARSGRGPRGWEEWSLAFVMMVGIATIITALGVGFITIIGSLW